MSVTSVTGCKRRTDVLLLSLDAKDVLTSVTSVTGCKREAILNFMAMNSLYSYLKICGSEEDILAMTPKRLIGNICCRNMTDL
jgi:hypothetical protein